MLKKDEFCKYIKMYESSLYVLAYSILHNDTDAAECISEAILRAYKNLDSLKNVKSFKPWIMMIVHNTGVEMIRKNAKNMLVEEMEEYVYEQKDIDEEMNVKEAINSLRSPYDKVVMLYYYEGFKVSEIAKITNSNSIRVRKQLQRAREMLKEILKEGR